jgi:hypothetical protein
VNSTPEVKLADVDDDWTAAVCLYLSKLCSGRGMPVASPDQSRGDDLELTNIGASLTRRLVGKRQVLRPTESSARKSFAIIVSRRKGV